MNYSEQIKELTKNVPVTLVDFTTDRQIVRSPTQASSNFITNKEQGDWAESLITRAINEISDNYIAVKYGKSDDLIAGDEGFDRFYQEFQIELDTIGKRPDLLIFKKTDYLDNFGTDISRYPHPYITEYVKKAIAGIEVRSSAFLIDKYEGWMQQRTSERTSLALKIRDEIIANYSDILNLPARQKYLTLLQNLTSETLSITSFTCPSWSSTDRLIELSNLFKSLKQCIKEVQKRDFLSITPKVEDIKVVYKWIETFNVPHFYFQVFFDKVYGISFEEILQIVSDQANEGTVFWVEKDTKNQNKTTIKIKSNIGVQIAYKVDEPQHKSVRKEMGRGRLLFYVSFEGGAAYLDVERLRSILNINEGEF